MTANDLCGVNPRSVLSFVTVDVYVRLREVLTSTGGEDPVRTVRGAAYALG